MFTWQSSFYHWPKSEGAYMYCTHLYYCHFKWFKHALTSTGYAKLKMVKVLSFTDWRGCIPRWPWLLIGHTGWKDSFRQSPRTSSRLKNEGQDLQDFTGNTCSSFSVLNTVILKHISSSFLPWGSASNISTIVMLIPSHAGHFSSYIKTTSVS